MKVIIQLASVFVFTFLLSGCTTNGPDRYHGYYGGSPKYMVNDYRYHRRAAIVYKNPVGSDHYYYGHDHSHQHPHGYYRFYDRY